MTYPPLGSSQKSFFQTGCKNLNKRFWCHSGCEFQSIVRDSINIKGCIISLFFVCKSSVLFSRSESFLFSVALLTCMHLSMDRNLALYNVAYSNRCSFGRRAILNFHVLIYIPGIVVHVFSCFSRIDLPFLPAALLKIFDYFRVLPIIVGVALLELEILHALYIFWNFCYIPTVSVNSMF